MDFLQQCCRTLAAGLEALPPKLVLTSSEFLPKLTESCNEVRGEPNCVILYCALITVYSWEQ